MLQFYRYLLAFRPDPRCYPQFKRIGDVLGLQVRLDLLHLTLCVIAGSARRDLLLAETVRTALRGARLHSVPVNLSRVVADGRRVAARTFGPQPEIQDFYSTLFRLLCALGIEPLYRKSGLHPHVSLYYRACPVALLEIAIRWFPSELLLIESEVGLTKHNVLERWPLLPPRQGLFPFDDDPFRSPRGARYDNRLVSVGCELADGLERVKGIEPSS